MGTKQHIMLEMAQVTSVMQDCSAILRLVDTFVFLINNNSYLCRVQQGVSEDSESMRSSVVPSSAWRPCARFSVLLFWAVLRLSIFLAFGEAETEGSQTSHDRGFRRHMACHASGPAEDRLSGSFSSSNVTKEVPKTLNCKPETCPQSKPEASHYSVSVRSA